MDFTRIADIRRKDFIVDEIKRCCAAGGSVLDIGCGNGIITMAVGNAGYQVKGIDASKKTIAVAKTSNRLPNVDFEAVGADELKPGPLRYDAIICSEVLEHLHEPELLLNIIHASLKDEGILIVTVPNGRGPRELFVTRPVQALQRNNGPAWRMASKIKSLMGYHGITVQSAADNLTHVQFFTSRSLKQLALVSGFYIEKIRPSNFIEQVFPFSLVFRRSKLLQKCDWWLANQLPQGFTSGFMSVWRKQLVQ